MSNNRDLLDSLYGIVDDLWRESDPRKTTLVTGAPSGKANAKPAAAPAPAMKSPLKETAVQAAAAPAAPVPEAPRQPEHPALDRLFSYADQVVDWTDALVKEKPDDGVTPEKTWAFFHAKAQGVLDGDPQVYREVLAYAQPLVNIQDYSLWMTASVEDSDHLTAEFEAEPWYMTEEAGQKKYLSAVALRMARDLFALLPANKVTVRAEAKGKQLLEVTWTRRELQKVNFAFTDTLMLADASGAQWSL